MKLMRFTAESTHKAMLKVHSTLGLNALIHATNTIDDGVEVIASLSTDEVTQAVQPKVVEINVLEKVQTNLEAIRGEFETLKKKIELQSWPDTSAEEQIAQQQNFVNQYLQHLGFSSSFRHHFGENFLKNQKRGTYLKKASILKAISKMLLVEEMELIDDKIICALVGPTGAGKTTTITKLVKRYAKKYGHETVGVITTDHRDVSVNNFLLNYCHNNDVELDYVNDVTELSTALVEMRNKNVILIDTGGISPRDSVKIASLLNLLRNAGKPISIYLTLPATLQENIMQSIAQALKKHQLAGCIITKEDESASLIPALSTCILNQLAVAYITNGQDTNANIYLPDHETLIKQINATTVEA